MSILVSKIIPLIMYTTQHNSSYNIMLSILVYVITVTTPDLANTIMENIAIAIIPSENWQLDSITIVVCDVLQQVIWQLYYTFLVCNTSTTPVCGKYHVTKHILFITESVCIHIYLKINFAVDSFPSETKTNLIDGNALLFYC